jgi:hypothetical protein
MRLFREPLLGFGWSTYWRVLRPSREETGKQARADLFIHATTFLFSKNIVFRALSWLWRGIAVLAEIRRNAIR